MFDEATMLRVADAYRARDAVGTARGAAVIGRLLALGFSPEPRAQSPEPKLAVFLHFAFCILNYDARVMTEIDRRDWLKQVTALGVASSLSAQPASAQGPAADSTKWFPGFKPFRVKTTGAEINGVIGGSGPPILLLHGAPQIAHLMATRGAEARRDATPSWCPIFVATATAASLPTARCT